MANIHGYPVVTLEGKRVGHVAGESETALVVECGKWPRKGWRALPKRYASIDDDAGSVMMQISRQMLAESPKLQRNAPVDDELVATWWALD